MGVGDKIKALRKSMGLTQTELGEKVGVKKNAVSKWECGRVEDIPTSTIKALSALFNVPPSYLIDDEGSEKAPTETGERSVSDAELKFALWGNSEDMDDDDLADVRRYAAFVRERKKDRK